VGGTEGALGRGRSASGGIEHALRGARQHRGVLGTQGEAATIAAISFWLYTFWTRETDRKLSPNKVLSTRIGADPAHPNWREFVIDFGGPKLAALPDGIEPEAIASCSGERQHHRATGVFGYPQTSNWRAIVKWRPSPATRIRWTSVAP